LFRHLTLHCALDALSWQTADGETSKAQPEPAASATPNAMQIDRDAELQATQGMVVELKAAYAVSLLLELKQYIKAAYKLDNERIANFSPYGVFL
jgi:hypothetical protein